MRTLTLVALLTCALLASPRAMAGAPCNGGSCTGGGNMLNHSLIEDFAKDAKDLPQYDQTEPYLKLMEERAPDFAKLLRSYTTREEMDAHGVQHYLIPRKFRELDSSITGLQFQTDQPAYQKGKEIFVSEEDAKAENPEIMGKFYFRELLEMSHPTKDAESVRKLVIYLQKNKFAPPQDNLVNMLQQLGFGKFETKRVQDEKLNVVKAFQEKRMENFYYYANRICDSWLGLPYMNANAFRANYKHFLGVKTSGGSGIADLNPSLAPELREYMIKFRNDLWKNEHFVSLHAALGMASVNMDFKEAVLGSTGRPVYNNGDENEMAYWYAAYSNRLAVTDDIRNLKSTLSPEALEKISKYEAKYKDMSSHQRMKQVCADVTALNRQRGQAPTEGSGSTDVKIKSGETGAQ